MSDKPQMPQKPAPGGAAPVPTSVGYSTDYTNPWAPPLPPPVKKRGRKAKAAPEQPETTAKTAAPAPAAPVQPPVRRVASPERLLYVQRASRDHLSKSVVAPKSPLADHGHLALPPDLSDEQGPLNLASIPPVPLPPVPALHSPGSSHSRDHRPLRIAHLYPSLLNVAGDGGNLIAIQRRAQWRGIPVEVVAVEKGERPDFRRFDIVLFHGGQDVEMKVAADDFALKAPSMRAAVEDGVVVFAVCAGLQLLGHRYVSNAGEEMKGAGILDLETQGGPQRFMQHAACEVEINGETETVVGFENHSGLTVLGPGCEPFGKVIAGAGNNGKDGLEGARRAGVFATYLHGPVLPKNAWLTDQLIRIAVGRAEGVAPSRVVLAPLDDTLENRAHEIALGKAIANRGRRSALEPAKLVRGQKR